VKEEIQCRPCMTGHDMVHSSYCVAERVDRPKTTHKHTMTKTQTWSNYVFKNLLSLYEVEHLSLLTQ